MNGFPGAPWPAGLRRVAGLLSVCALAASAGCTRWKAERPPVAAAIAEVGDRRARLTLTDGGHVRMAAPRVLGDSVIGYEAPQENGSRRAVAVADVRRVETQELDGSRTVGAVALAVGSVLLAWLGLIALTVGTAHT